ncbi:NAD(P)-binding protein [bacterium]|nr:NAD(P)-binding protein [bacterium]
MNVPKVSLERVVVVGGGFAGLKFAKTLDSRKFQVVLIDKNNYHTFQPLLYQVATAGLEPDSIAYPLRKAFSGKPNFFFRVGTVQSINPAARRIETSIGSLDYDHLVLAMGSSTNYYGNAQIEALSMPMKSVPEALNLRSLMLQNFEASLLTADLEERERLMDYVIVGGGPTGVELAGALSELRKHVLPNDYPDLDIRRMSVHLIQGGDRILPGMSEKSSKHALNYLKKLGVEVWLDHRVVGYDGQVVHTDKTAIPAGTVIWAAGVKGAAIEGLPSESVVQGRYKVDEFNRIEGCAQIYALGDIALMQKSPDDRGHPQVAQAAIQQARNLGRNLNRGTDPALWKPFAYKDKGSMATIGRNCALVDIGSFHAKGPIAWYLWMFVHLVTLVGFRNRLVALTNWISSYVRYDKGIRLIIRPFERKSA